MAMYVFELYMTWKTNNSTGFCRRAPPKSSTFTRLREAVNLHGVPSTEMVAGSGGSLHQAVFLGCE